MNILYLDWPCFGQENIKFYFNQMGYEYISFFHQDFLNRESEEFISAANKCINDSIQDLDFCFSYNYFPLMAEVCKSHNIKYISFVYDNPQVKLYSKTITYDTNYIFVFDSALVEDFNSKGFKNFYYMPLPVNGKIIDQLLQEPYDKDLAKCQVSFVGNLYNEEHNYFDELKGISEYTRGYLDGLLEAQCLEYGENFLEKRLTTQVIDDMQKAIDYHPAADGTEPLSYVFSDFVLARKLTNMERFRLLTAASRQYEVKLFTSDETALVGNCINMGIADYYGDLPYICHDSKINLNFTLRSIKTGIPLRAMDIMAYGGFLLSNYQSDFLKHFVPNEDFVYFESQSDMLNKIDYYLSHEDQRRAIAESGHDKILKNHDVEVILPKILNIVLG